jgi:hypothetical protein
MMCAAGPSLAAAFTPQEAKKVAVDAYIYGYSLMTSDVTEKAFINTLAPNPQTFQAPLNQFVVGGECRGIAASFIAGPESPHRGITRCCL